MFNKWEVVVKSGYDDICFIFESSEEATMFAKMAVASVQNKTDSNGKIINSCVKISAKAEIINTKEDN